MSGKCHIKGGRVPTNSRPNGGWLRACRRVVGWLVWGGMAGMGVAQSYSVMGPHSQNQALVYIPDSVELERPVRVLMALHGMRQTPYMICDPLRKMAHSLQAVLICPSGNQYEAGYTRTPLDERVHFSELLTHITTVYPVVPHTTILLGFSRGGTYAVETGLMYPTHFPNVVSICGFYSPFLASLLPVDSHQVDGLRVTLITGQTDSTLQPQTELASILQKQGITTTLYRYPNLIHALPDDLLQQLGAIFLQATVKTERDDEPGGNGP